MRDELTKFRIFVAVDRLGGELVVHSVFPIKEVYPPLGRTCLIGLVVRVHTDRWNRGTHEDEMIVISNPIGGAFARRTGETDWTRCCLNPYHPPTMDLSPRLPAPLSPFRLFVSRYTTMHRHFLSLLLSPLLWRLSPSKHIQTYPILLSKLKCVSTRLSRFL